MSETRRVDLHVHTDASDGIYAPEAVVDLACAAGLAAIAVTDHDTTAGVERARVRGREVGVEVVPGVELTAYAGPTEVHVLGLFVGGSDAGPTARVEELRGSRRTRMEKMVGKLADLGIEVGMDEVLAEAAGGALGRPHLAAVLVKRGYAADAGEAFYRYLGQDGPVHVRKERLTPFDAIALVGDLGGIAVLAHPGANRVDERLGEFRDAGLVGIEVWHPKHSPADVHHYARLAGKHGLLPSGGSDFHGPGRSEGPMGMPEIGHEVLDRLREAHAASVVATGRA